jgi:HSP20 family protein
MTTDAITEDRTRIVPEHIVYTDEDHTVFTAEIDLIGVSKEQISFKMRDDSFYLYATAGDKEYVMSHGICHPVDPHKARVTYHEGLLKMEAPFKKPLKPMITIPVE